MENHLVNKVSRFFPSSFGSCKLRTVPDVVESSIPITQKSTKTIHHTIQQPPKPFSNLAQNNPSMIKTGSEPKTLFKNNQEVSRYHKKSQLLGSDVEGRKCPPVAPVSVMALKKKEKAKETTKSNVKSSSSNSGRWFSSTDEKEAEFDNKSDAFFSLSSFSSESFSRKRAQSTSSTSWRRYDNKIFNDVGRCSSALSAYSVNTVLSQCSQVRAENQERSTNKSQTGTCQRWEPCLDKFAMEDDILKGCQIPEDLTELYYGNLRRSRCRKSGKQHRKKVKNEKMRKGEQMMRRAVDDRHDEFEVDDDIIRRVEDSYAVEKCSSDPYADFRKSMVEMIIEKQIFGAKDLEKLLDCFLSLNSSYYHRLIVEVFIEICDTLFRI